MFGERRLLLATFIALVPIARIAIAQDLEPRTYKSRSGDYALTVDPEARTGAGKARYTMQHGAATAWSAELPFALWDAVVADDGIAGGYAYTDGPGRDDGEFVVAILDAGGKVRASERAPRQWSPYLHTSGDPKANGLFLSADGSRLLVRVADADLNKNSEAWWTYRLSDGQLVGKPKPKDFAGEPKLAWMIDARPLPGTPLTLVQWLRSRCCESDDFGTVFALLDADAKPVWKLVLPRDYVAVERDPKDSVMNYIREKSAMLDASSPRRFDLWQVADRVRVSYAVEGGDDGTWHVRESDRKPQTQVPEEHAAIASTATQRVDLAHLGTIALETSATTGAIHDVYDFSIADRNRFAFVTGCGCSGKSADAALAIVDRAGRLLAKIPLPGAGEAHGYTEYKQAWLGGDRWVVTRSPFGVERRSTAFIVDAAARSVARLEAFDSPGIRALASTRDGGFVAVTEDWHKYNSTEGAAAFDADGRLRWSIGEGYDDEAKLFSATAVTVTTSGDVVVLEGVADKLKIYDRSGAYQRRLDLKVALKADPGYLSELESDATGGIILRQSNEKAPFVDMKLDGTIVHALVPSFADGRRFDARGNVQAATDGTLWTSDGGALLRVDTRGVVQDVVGSRPEADVLGKIATLAVSGSGKIYAADERTAAVHVFDGEGKRVHVCRPDTKDYDAGLDLPSLTVADGGDVFITRHDNLGATERALDFLHYSPACTRMGVESTDVDAITQRWYAQPGSTNRWILGLDHVYLVDAKGHTVRAIERDANGHWLLQPDNAATAPDGSIALVSNTPVGLGSVPANVAVYSRGGDAIVTWPYPGKSYLASMAYDGETVALLSGEPDSGKRPEVTLLDVRSGATRAFAPPSASDSSHIFIVARNGAAELWVSDGSTNIERYALR
ncbi:MAG TPA: hypothetical protein VFV97_09790 [Rhodanobacteraceae bacterium]|nr:hypothetical protein [Rhodanobacteraceae bacterium]